MLKPYISVTPNFNPVTYCARKHPHRIAIIHVTAYNVPPLDLYMEVGCNVQGLLHLAYNNKDDGEDGFSNEMALKTAKFIKRMIDRNISYLYVFYHYTDAMQANSIGDSIIKHIHPTQLDNAATLRKTNKKISKKMSKALKFEEVPQI